MVELPETLVRLLQSPALSFQQLDKLDPSSFGITGVISSPRTSTTRSVSYANMPASAHASDGSPHVPCSEQAREITPLLLGYFDAHATSAVSPANVAAHCTPPADSAVHCLRSARHSRPSRLPQRCVGSSHVPSSEQCTCSAPFQPSEHAASTVVSNAVSATATPRIVASGQPDTTAPQPPRPRLLQSSAISPQVKLAPHSTSAVPLCPLGQSRS